MKLLGCQQFAVGATLLIAACCMSCNRSATTTTAASKTSKPGPEESLSQIMDLFRRRMEETPIGFVTTNSSGRSAMTGTNKVSYDVIRPTTEAEPYKAVVTVVSQWHYSVLRSVEPPKDESRDKAGKDKSAGTLDEPDQGTIAFDSGESDAAAEESPNQKKPATRPGEEKVGRRDEQKTHTYDLIYENGRWKLVTKLDEKTERSIENAFNNALGTQI